MDLNDLIALPAAERARELANARERLRRMRFDASQGKLTKVRDIRAVRTMIARLHTLIGRDRAAR